MADQFLAALGCARRALARVTDPVADAHLLDRFVRERDEVAFAELVARHGPAVWAACRRGAPTAADAEDAFQATFLVLVRRADQVRNSASVGGWLFRIAVRLSARTRARNGIPIESANGMHDPAPDPSERAALRDLVTVLETELAGLPDSLRAALVSCYYEGLTQDDAARRLGWKVRTVRDRVARGRELLRRRLARRGIDLSAALAAVAAGTDLSASLPQMNLTTATGAVSPAVSELIKHGLELTAHTASLRMTVGIAAVVAVVGAGIGYAVVTGLGSDRGNGTGETHLVAATNPGGPQPAAEPPFDAAAVYDKAVDGCVYIVRETNGAPVEGTGALIDMKNRLVLATYSVVGESDVVSVQFPYHNADGSIEKDRKDYARSAAAKYLTPRGRLIHRDKTRDLALVQLDRLERHAHAIELAETNDQKAVLHIGSGTGRLFAMTGRWVSQGDAPKITVSGTAADSGGPLLDRDGKLIAVATGIAAGTADRPATVAIGVAEIRAFLAEKDEPISVPKDRTPTPPKETPFSPLDLTPGDLGPVVIRTPPDLGVEAQDLCAKIVKSCVYIITPLKGGFVQGSGSLIDVEQKLVLTNYHLVEQENDVFVQFPVAGMAGEMVTDVDKYKERIVAGQAIRGTVLFRDITRDLALLRLDKIPLGATAIPLAKTSPRIREAVWQIGNSRAVGKVFGVTKGEVSAVESYEFSLGSGSGLGTAFQVKVRAVSATNPTSPGDSGGPLFDKRGNLVAVTEGGSTRASLDRRFIDVTEVRAFLREKKITIKEPSDEPDPKTGTVRKGDNTSTSGDDERAAAAKLRSAKLFANNEEFRDVYIKKLKEVIATWPNTEAGKEAKKLFDKVKKPGDEPERKGDVPPAPTAADERTAAEKLRSAKLFANGEDNRPLYVNKLKEIVAKWPNTAGGKEAKKLLDGLK
jgi:RNA polymerase sigma factor (sigma-70 family)